MDRATLEGYEGHAVQIYQDGQFGFGRLCNRRVGAGIRASGVIFFNFLGDVAVSDIDLVDLAEACSRIRALIHFFVE